MTQHSLLAPDAVWVTAGDDIACAQCGVVFWMTSQMQQQRRADHKGFYCPSGHENYYPQETDAEKYKRQLKHARDESARLRGQLDQTEASRRAWKGQATRARNRAAAGQCPVCGESVPELKQHMDQMHVTEGSD